MDKSRSLYERDVKLITSNSNFLPFRECYLHFFLIVNGLMFAEGKINVNIDAKGNNRRNVLKKKTAIFTYASHIFWLPKKKN